MSDAVVRACPVTDELVTDGGALVLLSQAGGHRVIRLSVLGQLIRELSADGIPLVRLAEQLEARVGSPPRGDALELVRHAVAELQADGLVSIDSSDRGEQAVQTVRKRD